MNAFARHVAFQQQHSAARHIGVQIAQEWLEFARDHEKSAYWDINIAVCEAEISRCMEIARKHSYEALVALAMLQHDMTRDEAELYLATA